MIKFRSCIFILTTSMIVVSSSYGEENVLISKALFPSASASGPTELNVDADVRQVSSNGRYIVYSSAATNLASNDNNGSFVHDVFRYDRVTETVDLVSVAMDGLSTGNGESRFPSISADGNMVSFQSAAEDLTANDGNGVTDVFIRDMSTGVTTLISVNSANISANGESVRPFMNNDGTKISFRSSATDLVPIDGNNLPDVFVRDLVAGTTSLVSFNQSGSDSANGISQVGKLSDDGNVVVFFSTATDLTTNPDNNNTSDIFARDLSTNTTKLVTINTSGAAGAQSEFVKFSLSGNGTRIAFNSSAFDLTSIPTPGNNVFVRDTTTDTTFLVTKHVSLNSGTSGSDPHISADGTQVVFWSSSVALVAGDTNFKADVFLHDLTTSQTSIVSLNSSGNSGSNGDSFFGRISDNGQTVVYYSKGTDIAGQADNGFDDIYSYDIQSGTSHLLSSNLSGVASNGSSRIPIVNDDGSVVAFDSFATDLVPNDLNNAKDVFVSPVDGGGLQLATPTSSAATPSQTASGNSSNPQASADGRYIAFCSSAGNLVNNDFNGRSDVFRYDRITGTVELASVGTDGNAGNNSSNFAIISGDGMSVAFYSQASNLVPTDTNEVFDLFVRNFATQTTELVTINVAGTDSSPGPNTSPSYSISFDGSRIAFFSRATDLVSNDNNGFGDVFVRDFNTSQTTAISLDSTGSSTGNQLSFQPAISGNGEVVVFASVASNLVNHDSNGTSDVFAHDLLLGTTTLVSRNSSLTGSGNGSSILPSIDFSGDVIAFESQASDLVGVPDNNGLRDVFVYNRPTGSLNLISSAFGVATVADGTSLEPRVSSDGSKIVFASDASNLTTSFNALPFLQIYVYDVASTSKTLVTVDSTGNLFADGDSDDYQISGDGTKVVFTSRANNLDSADTEPLIQELFVRDFSNQTTNLISRNFRSGQSANAFSLFPRISQDGSIVIYESDASDIVFSDVNNNRDVFAFEFECGPVLGDVNRDGLVNLLDVGPFIDVLASGGFQVEADVNEDGQVNLLDVSALIDVLSGG